MCCTNLMVMGDFNAKVGHCKVNDKFIGSFGGERNERVERLVAMTNAKRTLLDMDLTKWWDKK